MLCSQRQELGPQFLRIHTVSRLQLDADDRELAFRAGHAHQAASADLGMGIEDGLAHEGEDRALGGLHDLVDPPAAPEAAGSIEIAGISEAVPGASVTIGNLVLAGALLLAEVERAHR